MKLALFPSTVGIVLATSASAVMAADAPVVDDVGLTADDYATAIDYDVSYDDQVAQGYDDGYDPHAYEPFRTALAPYGSWVDDADYGQVWVPSPAVVGDDFSPYATGGTWTDSEYGWTWVSDFAWGWAPFHYGRWTTVANHGWAWVPGTLWGPAWVSWRAGAGCVGWAPLPPRGVGLASPLGSRSPWRFVGAASFGRARPTYLATSAVPRIFGRMSVVSSARTVRTGDALTRVNAGPVVRGQPAPSQLASVAPGVIPRFAVRPRAGMPLTARAWVHAGITEQLAFGHGVAPMARSRASLASAPSAFARSYTPTGRWPAGDGRPYTLGATARGAPRMSAGFDGGYAGMRWWTPRAPGSSQSTTPSVPQFTAGVPQFTAGAPRFTSSSPPSSSSGGGWPAFRGGGHPSSWGGGGGGRGFGGGGRRR